MRDATMDRAADKDATGTVVSYATRNRMAREIIARLYGQAAFGWGLDEPNGATGYQLRAEADSFAYSLVVHLREAGFDV